MFSAEYSLVPQRYHSFVPCKKRGRIVREGETSGPGGICPEEYVQAEMSGSRQDTVWMIILWSY